MKNALLLLSPLFLMLVSQGNALALSSDSVGFRNADSFLEDGYTLNSFYSTFRRGGQSAPSTARRGGGAR